MKLADMVDMDQISDDFDKTDQIRLFVGELRPLDC